MNFDFSDITKQLDQLQVQIELPPAPDVYIGDEFIKSNTFQQQQLEIMKKQQKMLEDMKVDAEKESTLSHTENKRNYKFNITNTILVALTLLVAVAGLVVSVIALSIR